MHGCVAKRARKSAIHAAVGADVDSFASVAQVWSGCTESMRKFFLSDS